jgi:multidrug efflux pump subunit AcrA (membrane-fusion protein)
LCAALALLSCGRHAPQVTQAASPTADPSPSSPSTGRAVRATGTIQPVRFFVVQSPRISGQGGGRLTLVRLVPNGARVRKGDLVAEFDRTQQMDLAREAQGKYDGLTHQVEQRQAQNRADSTKRTADLRKAEADLAKAELQLRKGPLLAEIERLKAEVRAADARAHVASLQKSNAWRDKGDAAALRILELQRDRQKVSLERASRNIDLLEVKAPLAGMVALENIWKGSSYGQPQEGDQMWPGQALLRLFDASEMEVRVSVAETDGAALAPGARAQVRLDAYPDLMFGARFESASPAAASPIGSPIKTFSACFRLDRADSHLLPDLSAAVVIEPPKAGPR